MGLTGDLAHYDKFFTSMKLFLVSTHRARQILILLEQQRRLKDPQRTDKINFRCSANFVIKLGVVNLLRHAGWGWVGVSKSMPHNDRGGDEGIIIIII